MNWNRIEWWVTLPDQLASLKADHLALKAALGRLSAEVILSKTDARAPRTAETSQPPTPDPVSDPHLGRL